MLEFMYIALKTPQSLNKKIFFLLYTKAVAEMELHHTCR